MRNHIFWRTTLFAFISGLLSSMAFASPNSLTYQGRILKADGTPLEYSAVSFQLDILAPNGTCLIYREAVSNVDMRNSGGVFDLAIGQSHSYPASAGFGVLDVFNNSSSITCYDGSTYTPASTDGRILRVSFHDGSSWHTNPDMDIRSVPYASYSALADSAAKLGTNVAADFILKNGVSATNCDSGNFLTWNAATKAFGCAAVSGAAGGTVTNVTASSPLSVANGTSTPALSIAKATSTTDGYLSATDWVTFNSKQSPATTLAGYGITDAMQANASAGGDLSGNYPNPTVAKIKGAPVTLTAIADGQVLKYSSGSWVNTTLSSANLSDAASLIKTSQMPASCSAGQTLTFSSPSGAWACSTISVSATNFGVQPQKTFLAGPTSGVDATPQFRTLAATDLPSGVATQWTTSGSDIYYTTGKVGVGTTTPATKLQVNGSLMIGDGAETCGATYAGALRYNSSSVQFCNGSAWTTLGTGSGTGTVTSVTSFNPDISVATTTTTPVLTLNSTTSGGGTEANKIAKLDGSGLLAVSMIPSIPASKITSGQIAVANGGTGLSSGTSGGIPYFNSSSTMASSAALTANAVLLGGGAGAAPTVTSAGAANQILRVPAGGGAPDFGAIDLSQAAVVGTSVLPIANGGTGASTAAAARTNLGLGTAAVTDTGAAAGNVPVLGTGGLVANQMCVANGSATGVVCTSTIPTSSQWTTSGSDIYYNTGKVGVGTTTPATKLQVSGSLMIGDGAETCGATYAGALRYNSSSVQFCNGSAWTTLGTGSGTGTVTSVTSFNPDISVATTTTTPVLTLNSTTSGGGTEANKIAKLDGSGLLAVSMIPSIPASKITSGQIAVANGGTGLSSGTSGGIPYFSSSSTMASSAALTANGVVLGGGAGASPTSTAAGTANQILRVPAGGGAPLFGSIDLSQSAVVGTSVLPIANGGTGASTAAAARTNLGLGTAAVTDTGALAGNVPVLGTGGLVANQMCVANSGATGIICNSTIPTSSQWTTSGSDIYYTTGKVGIGTTSPTRSLEVNGTVKATTFEGDGSALTGVIASAPGSTYDIPVNKAGALAAGDTPFQFKSKLTGVPLSSLLIGGTGPNWSNGAHIQLVADTSYWSQFEFFNGDSGTTATDGAAILFTGTDLDFNNREAGDLTLSTANTKRVTVSSTGAVGIGTTSPLESLEVVGNIKSSGCLYYASSSLGTCASDQRIKKDVHSFDLGLEALLGIRPVKFKYNGLAGLADDGQEQMGVIAQEVEKSAPELVQKKMVHLHKGDSELTEIKVVDYGAFTYVIINAIKEFYHQWISEKEGIARKLSSLENEKVDRAEFLKVQAENARLQKENEAMKARLEKVEKALGLSSH